MSFSLGVDETVSYSDVDAQASVAKVRKEYVYRASPIPKEATRLN